MAKRRSSAGRDYVRDGPRILERTREEKPRTYAGSLTRLLLDPARSPQVLARAEIRLREFLAEIEEKNRAPEGSSLDRWAKLLTRYLADESGRAALNPELRQVAQDLLIEDGSTRPQERPFAPARETAAPPEAAATPTGAKRREGAGQGTPAFSIGPEKTPAGEVADSTSASRPGEPGSAAAEPLLLARPRSEGL